MKRIIVPLKSWIEVIREALNLDRNKSAVYTSEQINNAVSNQMKKNMEEINRLKQEQTRR